MVFDPDDEFKAYNEQGVPVNATRDFTRRENEDFRETHTESLNTSQQTNVIEKQQKQQQKQQQQQEGPVLSSLLGPEQFSSLSTGSLYSSAMADANDKLRIGHGSETYGRRYTTHDKLPQLGDPSNQQYRALPFHEPYGGLKPHLNIQDKDNSNPTMASYYSSNSQNYAGRPKTTSFLRPTKSLSPETLGGLEDGPGASMMVPSTSHWATQPEKSYTTNTPSCMEHIYGPSSQMKGRVSRPLQHGSEEQINFLESQHCRYPNDGMPLEYTSSRVFRNSAAHEAFRYSRPGRDRAHGLSNNYRVSRSHRHASSLTQEPDRQMAKGHKVRSHRRKNSRPADSIGSGTLSMALVAPTLVPGMPITGGSMGPQISEPPGGVYWALLSKFVDEGRADPSEDYLQGGYEESVTVPIQMCQPPLSNIYPAYPHALEGDQAPRIRKQSKYTAEQDRQILELKNKGKAWAEIARLAKCHNQLAARNRYQVLIGQQGGGSFLWTTADCSALQAILDEGERAKWLFLASEMSKKLETTFSIDAVHYKICQLFANTPERFGVIRTRDPNRGGAPFKRKLLDSTATEPSIS